jgi:hypothetical protein
MAIQAQNRRKAAFLATVLGAFPEESFEEIPDFRTPAEAGNLGLALRFKLRGANFAFVREQDEETKNIFLYGEDEESGEYVYLECLSGELSAQHNLKSLNDAVFNHFGLDVDGGHSWVA